MLRLSKKSILCQSQTAGIEEGQYSQCNLHISSEDAVDQILLGKVEGALQFIVIERDFSSTGAVQSGLHESCPSVLQQKPPSDIIFANPCHTRIHSFPTVMFHCVLTEEEVGEQADVIGSNKVRL